MDRKKAQKLANYVKDKELSFFDELNELNDKLERVEGLMSDTFSKVSLDQLTHLKGEAGKDGMHGRDGKDGRHGLDGKDGKNGRDGKDGRTPIAGIDYPIPRDGRDGTLLSPQEIRDKLASLEESDRLNVSAIQGVPTFDDFVERVKKDKPFSALDLKDGRSIVYPGKKQDLRWHGSGVSRLTASTGISIASTNPDTPGMGELTISATGGFSPFVTVGFSDADYICDGTDDYVQIRAALVDVRDQGGGTVFIKEGTYDMSDFAKYYDNTEIVGTPGTILKRRANTLYSAIFINENVAGSTVANKNIRIHGLTLDGGGDVNGYNQQLHCIGIYGVEDIAVFDVRFVNMCGDGIYVSSTNTTYDPSFVPARRFRIHNNHFEGVNLNRNSISVIDAEDGTIYGNTFYRSTGVHPGAIDLEPNIITQRVRNITIVGNTFTGCQRGVQMLNAFAGSGRCTGVTISGNTFDGSLVFDIYGVSWANVQIGDNTSRSCTSRSIEFEDTSSVDISGGSIFFPQSSAVRFENCGAGATINGLSILSAAANGISLRNTDNVTISGCTIRSWGTALTTYAAVYGEEGCEDVTISGCSFTDPDNTHTAVVTEMTCNNWQIGPNKYSGVARKFNLVNTNTIISPNIGGRVTTQFDKTNTTLSNVPGLSASVIAGETYQFEANLFIAAGATGGSKYTISGTATATSVVYQIILTDNSTLANTIVQRKSALGSSGGQAGTTAGFCVIKGTITVATSGTLTVQFAQNVSNSTSSVLVGSNFSVMQVL